MEFQKIEKIIEIENKKFVEDHSEMLFVVQ
jgi:hypothetical protein